MAFQASTKSMRQELLNPTDMLSATIKLARSTALSLQKASLGCPAAAAVFGHNDGLGVAWGPGCDR